MNKLVAVLLGLSFCSSVATAQEVEMIVRLTNNRELTFNVDDILEMRATPSPAPRNRVVVCHEYFGELSFSGSMQFGPMKFHRNPGRVSLSLPGGGTVVSGPIPQQGPASYCIGLTFHSFARGSDITRLPSAVDRPYHVGTAWHDTTIYASYWSIQKYILDNGALPQKEDSVTPHSTLGIEVNDAGTKIAFPLQRRSYTHYGKLVELDLVTGMLDTLTVDSTVTSVRYFADSDDLVYYTYGSFDWDNNREPDDAGYYKLDRSTNTITQLLKYTGRSGSEELWNGFDLSHDGKKLLVPSTHKHLKPVLLEYDIAAGTMDTLPITFTLAPSYNNLWAQYSSDDSLILFSLSYVTPSVMMLAGGNSEVGIFDRSTGVTKEVFLSPTNDQAFCAPFPRWSPDNRSVCYGGCVVPAYYFEWIDPFYVYIKKLEP